MVLETAGNRCGVNPEDIGIRRCGASGSHKLQLVERLKIGFARGVLHKHRQLCRASNMSKRRRGICINQQISRPSFPAAC